MNLSIRLVYLYLFSTIGLLVVVMGSVRMVDLGLKTFVFPDSDKYEYYAPQPIDEKMKFDEQKAREQAHRDQQRNRQREFSGAVAMIAVGLPLYLYHWRLIKKESKK